MMLYHLKVKVVLYFKTKIGKFLALEFKASSLISILERTIRAAVEQHLFDLQSSIDHDLKNLQQQSLVCNNEAGSINCDGEGSNNQ